MSFISESFVESAASAGTYFRPEKPALIEHAVKMCQSFALAGINTTMNQLNKK